MTLVYSQSKGSLAYAPDGKDPRILGRGYAGHPPYVNDPEAQALKARGPIPPRQNARVFSIRGIGEDYWVDLRDLFLHGEQFRNHDLSDQGNPVALPDADMGVRYANLTMADALFAGTKKFLRADGLLTLDIASSVHKDMTL